MSILAEIEAFLKASGLSATAFGTHALNDPPFVAQLREGRDIKLSTAEKCRAFMANWKPDQAAANEAAECRTPSAGTEAA